MIDKKQIFSNVIKNSSQAFRCISIRNAISGNIEMCNGKKIKKQSKADHIIRVVISRMLLWEIECDEGSTLFFKVKKNTIIERHTRDRDTTAS